MEETAVCEMSDTDSAVAVRKPQEEPNKTKKRLLDFDEYYESMEQIVQRDFFPDVTKLQAQNDYLEAEENGDLQRMREIAIKYGSAMAKYTPRTYVPYVTPSSFETPDGHSSSPSSSHNESRTGRDTELGGEDGGKEEELPCLDRFLSENTCEERASFMEMMALTQEKQKRKNAWLYEAESESKQRREDNLAVPSLETQARGCVKAGVDTWEYTVKNALMYYPEGVKDDTLFKKPREVMYKNTRFNVDPFCKALNKSQIQQAAALNAQFKLGKVGPDGKELLPHESPKMNGYGYERASLPPSAVCESPLMTWGEIEETPFRADGSVTPLIERSHGPAFKIPEPGRRERLGLKMANEVAAKNRAKKQEALRKVTENLASLTPKGLSPAALSPALQRLVNRSSGKYTDKALRASYTPSPYHRVPGSKTPLTPSQSLCTPTPGKTRTPASHDPASITDNLLQLPKRRKASDFF
ncbi:splicing factor ESS-2 homolog isoform X2 [Neoarius graeffei]|uniref:splicing factor ESS-2 homolog isoform X2 n=1 Tax=Neoarius graeffei TaxID=443677 RepID=UPI00298D2C79|nr:splicing factor ESS-2 homolog isoform X2 [Neoarius graeffei]